MAGRRARAREKRRALGPVFNLFKKIFQGQFVSILFTLEMGSQTGA
jgi:hypothetical protein